mgnify:CR=1 FL=1
MRSKLSNEIFHDEMLSLYQQKDLSYQQVRDTAIEAMGRLIRRMETGLCHSPVIETQMETLAGMLVEVKGKKVYGYLKKPVKAQVDAIVDELGKLPEVAECYEHWNRLRDELECYYKDTPREHKPLSQQKEFKAIKNMVIQEAEQVRHVHLCGDHGRYRQRERQTQHDQPCAHRHDGAQRALEQVPYIEGVPQIAEQHKRRQRQKPEGAEHAASRAKRHATHVPAGVRADIHHRGAQERASGRAGEKQIPDSEIAEHAHPFPYHAAVYPTSSAAGKTWGI